MGPGGSAEVLTFPQVRPFFLTASLMEIGEIGGAGNGNNTSVTGQVYFKIDHVSLCFEREYSQRAL